MIRLGVTGTDTGVGKTLIAERVARQVGVCWGQVDDFHHALHAVLTGETAGSSFDSLAARQSPNQDRLTTRW